MQVREILQEEEDLSEIVQLVGKVSLLFSTFRCHEFVELAEFYYQPDVTSWHLKELREC